MEEQRQALLHSLANGDSSSSPLDVQGANDDTKEAFFTIPDNMDWHNLYVSWVFRPLLGTRMSAAHRKVKLCPKHCTSYC
eukprot:scaffold277917_cov48-Attheya_sp.AAC.4